MVGGLGALVVMMFYVSTSVLPQTLVTLSKASPATKISLSGSYVIGEKMVAKADGSEAATINVFLLDANSQGVAGKSVSLTGVDNIKAVGGNALSNSDGKVSFELRSTTEGVFPITALVEGVELPRKVSVTFRN